MPVERPLRHHGRYPELRLRLSATFIAALVAETVPLQVIAADVGFGHPQRLSNLLRDPHGVTATQRPVFERLARWLRFPTDQIFVEPADRGARS